MTSPAYVATQRKHFWTYYLPSKFCCRSFNILGVLFKKWGGGGGANPLVPVSADQKSQVRVSSYVNTLKHDFFFLSADIDECNTPSGNNCSLNADCVNKPGSFECKCRPGYFGDGVACTGRFLYPTQSS